MYSFRPTLIPTLFTIPALIVLLYLGTWQLQRLQWKNALVHAIEEKIAIPEAKLPEHLPDAELKSWQYRRVTLTGTFLHDKELYLYAGAREYRGDQGYRVFTPLKRKDGRIILIDRGWVPQDKKAPATRPQTQEKGEQTIHGAIMLGEQKHYFTPENMPGKNMWYWIDIPAMRHTSGEPFQDFYIMEAEDKQDKKKLPYGQDLTVKIRNDHLQYAITWYSAALSLIVIYILYHRKKLPKQG